MTDEREIPKIRTMRSDARDLIKDTNISQLDIATKQYVSQKKERKIHFEELPLKKMFIFIIILLVFGIGSYFGYKIYMTQIQKSNAILEKSKPQLKIVAADDEKVIGFQEALPGELIAKINEERRRPLKFDTILYIQIEIDQRIGGKKFIDAGSFVKSLSWRVGSSFVDNLYSDFNALITHSSESRDFAVLFKVRDFKLAVGSLIEWERTMSQDFKPFFGEEDASTLNQFVFYDEIIKNNDSRVLKNSSGKTILAYSIFNKQFVIISTSRNSLSLVLDRLIKLPPR